MENVPGLRSIFQPCNEDLVRVYLARKICVGIFSSASAMYFRNLDTLECFNFDIPYILGQYPIISPCDRLYFFSREILAESASWEKRRNKSHLRNDNGEEYGVATYYKHKQGGRPITWRVEVLEANQNIFPQEIPTHTLDVCSYFNDVYIFNFCLEFHFYLLLFFSYETV